MKHDRQSEEVTHSPANIKLRHQNILAIYISFFLFILHLIISDNVMDHFNVPYIYQLPLMLLTRRDFSTIEHSKV